MKNTDSIDLFNSIEQRADYLDEHELLVHTAKNDAFDNVFSELLKKQTTLIVGPRGCGKTHLMRYTALICKSDKSKPLAVYVSFNRYYRLEPLLGLKVNALEIFHSWVLSRILLEVIDIASLSQMPVLKEDFATILDADRIKNLINKIERGIGLLDDEIELCSQITIYRLIELIEIVSKANNRTRAILLMDDAALTLTPEYMKEFFDIFRVIKTPKLSVKASVYPGTTEYGARFHPTQEGKFEHIWMSVESSTYLSDLEAIAVARVDKYDQIPVDIANYLKYAAFGVPRAFLFMLQEYMNEKNIKNKQQVLNKIVQNHLSSRIDEFRSIAIKAPKFKSLIDIGLSAFNKIVSLIKESNAKNIPLNNKQIRFGIEDASDIPLAKRMLNLLVEVGLLFEISEKVSHGDERNYIRFIPHFSALFEEKIFTPSERGWSVSTILERISYSPVRQPVRRKISTLLSKDELSSLKLNLPPCTSCGTERLNTSQKFCHHCGNELVDRSSYETCLTLPLHEIPGLTEWQRKKIREELPKIKSIGDFLSTQDPSAELRQVNRFGPVKAGRIIDLVNTFIDEFLQ